MNAQLVALLANILQLATAVSQTLQTAASETRDPTPDEVATHEAGIQQLNAQWAALAPKGQA